MMTDTTQTSPSSDTGTGTGTGKAGLADALREHFSGGAPLTEKVQNFARARPWASAMLVGVAGLLLTNTLRGRGR